MIWFFQRGEESTKCQLRADPDNAGYDFIVTSPDGEESVEHFRQSKQAVRRWTQLEAKLRQQGWSGPHGP